MKVTIEGIVDVVDAYTMPDGTKLGYFDVKQKGDRFRAGEIIRITGNGHSEGDEVTIKADLRVDKGKLKVRQIKETEEEVSSISVPY